MPLRCDASSSRRISGLLILLSSVKSSSHSSSAGNETSGIFICYPSLFCVWNGACAVTYYVKRVMTDTRTFNKTHERESKFSSLLWIESGLPIMQNTLALQITNMLSSFHMWKTAFHTSLNKKIAQFYMSHIHTSSGSA